MHSDTDLVRRIQSKDSKAFEKVFEEHAPALTLRLIGILGNRETAEDMLQETFLRFWSRIGRYDGRGSLGGWLTSIATNLALNHLRYLRRRPQQALECVTVEVDDQEHAYHHWPADAATLQPPELLERAEEIRLVRRCINTLSDDKREAIRLVFDEDLSIREASQIMAASWVLLNRAPTLEPTAITALRPVPRPERVIRIHPLVCRWFNADFDGDQMVLFLLLTEAAQEEAGRRLSVQGHLARDPDLLWGLARLSLSDEGRQAIISAATVALPMPEGIVTRSALDSALRTVLENEGVAAALAALEKLATLGFAEAQNSGATPRSWWSGSLPAATIAILSSELSFWRPSPTRRRRPLPHGQGLAAWRHQSRPCLARATPPQRFPPPGQSHAFRLPRHRLCPGGGQRRRRSADRHPSQTPGRTTCHS